MYVLRNIVAIIKKQLHW